MPANNPQLQRRTRFVNAWFTSLDSEQRGLLRSGRFRLLLLSGLLLALLLLVSSFLKGDEAARTSIYEIYLNNTGYVNNWDLVDSSAEHIVGAYLMNRSKSVLYRLAESENLWERRISIMSTFHFIKRHQFSETLKISKMLLSDGQNLIHKATGWMLREIGKRHLQTEESFLKVHYQKMPRTMLRYAIEKFPEPKRQRYLKGRI